jgi:hypothetical protein
MHLDFLVPGFSKCGTTTLCALLNDHPELFVPEQKEPNFFAWNWKFGWNWYEERFVPGANKRFHGEGSQGYASDEYAEVCACRIQEHFPRTKLIFLARDPISRLASSFREMHHHGHIYGAYPPYSIGAAIQKMPNMWRDTRYWHCINIFRRYFPDEQIHVAFAEDMRKDTESVIRGCFKFLGVDADVEIPDLNRNLNSGSEKLYDTPLMRSIRQHKIHRLWYKVPYQKRRRFERVVGLRKPFDGPVEWDQEAIDFVKDKIEDDARQFLEFYGKPADFWKLEMPAEKTASAA